ncbi:MULTISPECIES: hypothetical protein [unclassified Mesorhizobium]|uniref:hypothetical protein n=1 Tax=unclassified Mesorhizobium TaxID=325217 RepID=UPI000F74DD82|nr:MULTISPECIES: hypothetical protein [unclassified Mesorhizobium]AZO14217.1 hypothetical protein EJ069_05460 [Mesorhizobium sp. M2A.F.Ca.ET.043.05.1.1]RWD70912.1 MAG: hypothetical protein EOS37_13435 [Mesorhizobium sp.]TIV58255.1 MAG: hypothetical protein E5V80_19285 [Mesorhizobium sp.]
MPHRALFLGAHSALYRFAGPMIRFEIDPDFRVIRPVEGERDGHANAGHTRPWHSRSAAVGVLRAAGIAACGRDISTAQLQDD